MGPDSGLILLGILFLFPHKAANKVLPDKIAVGYEGRPEKHGVDANGSGLGMYSSFAIPRFTTLDGYFTFGLCL